MEIKQVEKKNPHTRDTQQKQTAQITGRPLF